MGPADYQQLEERPVVGVPMQSKVSSVEFTLVQRDGRFVFPEAYSLDFTGKMSRDELLTLIEELNATALQHGPNTGGARAVLGYLPIVNIATHMTWRSQYQTMLQELQKACAAINERYAAKDGGRVNLIYREVPWQSQRCCHRRRCRCGPGAMLAQVEVQVLGV